MSEARIGSCPACGHHVAVPFFDGGNQPLATIAWPESAAQARALPRLPLDFVQCVNCTHIYNAAFDYAHVPYSTKPNLMFNRATAWSEFIRALQGRVLERVPARPMVVEIGHGDASFLAGLAALRPGGRYVGFDPHGASGVHGDMQLRAELFLPEVHVAELVPDIVITRHILEHLQSPVSFLQSIAFFAAQAGREVRAYIEVPCVDRVQETGRTADLYYEHSSQFTTRSFTAMLEASGARIDSIEHAYDREVVTAFLSLRAPAGHSAVARASRAYLEAARRSQSAIAQQLDALARDPGGVAIWGGTGKSAAFMNRYGCDAARFPVVVDSDASKAGTFVPGTGQEIRFRDWLKEHPARTLIVPPQWRAADIVREIRREGIAATRVLIEHEGSLVDFLEGEHPYVRP
jgi:hypothetical protein